MSIDEIKQMVQDILQLKSRQLKRVIRIVKNNEPWLIKSHPSDQIELNFAEMAPPSLRQLQSFIAESLKRRDERPERGAFTVHSKEPMSTNEIRRLAQDLNQLRGEAANIQHQLVTSHYIRIFLGYRLDGVIQIIRSNERGMRHWHPYEAISDKQVSLGKFRPRTLRKIRWYLEFSEDFSLV